MNRGAVFSEDEQLSAALGDSLDGLIAAILRGEITDAQISNQDQQRHSFFIGALEKLASQPGSITDSPLVLKSFSPDGDESFLVTVAFKAAREGGDQIEKIVEFHAYPSGDGYRFESPFAYRTRNLKSFEVGSVRYHFEGSFDRASAEEFVEFKTEFETSVGTEPTQLDYYRFETLDDLLKAYGIVYDCTRCNWLKNDLGFMDNNGQAFVTGTGNEQFIFDYLVDYMSMYCDEDGDLYPPFVYGMAACFGGYGLSGDDLDTLKAQFREELEAHPELDFLEEFRKGRKSSVKRHFTNFVICAFICEEVLDRHGFEVIMELAHAGRSGERFFESLENLIGLDENNFHETVVRFIQED